MIYSLRNFDLIRTNRTSVLDKITNLISPYSNANTIQKQVQIFTDLNNGHLIKR